MAALTRLFVISVKGDDVRGYRNSFGLSGSVSKRGTDGWHYGLCDGKRWRRSSGKKVTLVYITLQKKFMHISAKAYTQVGF